MPRVGVNNLPCASRSPSGDRGESNRFDLALVMKSYNPFSATPRRSRRGNGRFVTLPALCLLLAASAMAQVVGGRFSYPDPNTSNVPTYNTHGSVLLLTVGRSPKGHLDRQAVVRLLNRNTGIIVWQTTNDRGEASFGDLDVGSYDLEVSAVGYLTARKSVKVQASLITYHEEMALERDPSSINLEATSNAAEWSKKARKAIQRAVAALKSANYKEAEKQLKTAVTAAPDSVDANFLSGYLAFEQKRYDAAKGYLHKALTLDPHNVQAALLLGRTGLQQGDYNAAKTALEQAVAIDSKEWMPHYQLAEAYLKQREFEKAKEQAQLAIASNQVASTPAQLVLGEALANLGRSDEAIQAFKTFLEKDPENPVAAQVREFIPQLSRLAAERAAGQSVPSAGPLVAPDSQLASAGPQFTVKDWQPPSVDDSKPPVAAGVACPTEMVVSLAGKQVKQLADDVARFAAIEDLVHERLDTVGYPITRETRKFNYVVSITDNPPNGLELSEYRSEHSGPPEFPDNIASSGFISLAMVFHPSLRDEFQMTCEGLGDWHGQTTWLVYFRQRTDRPNRLHSYVLNGKGYPVGLKGRAWIKTDSFQIVRMESDLVSPAPAIQLASEHQIVEYGPVMFAKKNEELWLPQSAQLYFEFRKRRYFRRHSFDHFMLFSVDAAEKRNEPKEPAQEPVPVPN